MIVRLLTPAESRFRAGQTMLEPEARESWRLPKPCATRLSRRITTRHPLRSLLFAAGCAILLLLGFLLGGIGLVVTAPWVLGARARMHDELFGTRHATAA